MSNASEMPLPEALYSNNVHDISAPMETAPVYPGDDSCIRHWVSKFEEGADYSLSALTLGSHTATHLDFPSHLFKNGKALDKYPLARFITPARVISVEEGEAIPPSALLGLEIDKGEALLFKTRNSQQRLMHDSVFSEKYVCLSLAAAQLCVSCGTGLVGIDYLSVDSYGDASLPVHRTLLENDVLVLEGIDLGDVPCGRYWLICLPLRINDAEASPVRAVLVGPVG